jgi:NADPH2:quinone reductase
MMAAKTPGLSERQMKALQYTRFGSPEVLQLVDRPIPRASEEDAVVQVEAAAVQPSDIKGVAGVMDGTVLPRTPGRDFSGTVVEGPTWLLGRAVWGTAGDLGFSRDGTHAEYVRFPVAGLGPRRWGLSAEQAAAVPVTFITAWIGLLDAAAQVRKGETVVVFGVTGGVGCAVTQLAHWRGARVIGVDHVAPADDIGPAARPDVFVGTAGLELVEAVRDATNGRGADVGFDAVGGSDFESHLGALAPRGRLAAVASVGAREVSFDLINFYRRELRLFGVNSREVDAAAAARILERLELGFLTGALAPPRIAARFPLSSAREAYEVVARGDARGRVVLVPR